MKKIINGGLSAASFVLLFLLLSIVVSSCGGSQLREAKSLTASPDTSGGISKPKVVISCLNNNCGSITLSSHDSSQGPGNPKFVLDTKTTVDIPANTNIRVEVYFEDSAHITN
jgi:hypothetical protein